MATLSGDHQQGAKITVHWLESSRAQRILILLEELGLQYEIKPYKRDKDGLAPPELAQVHPLGKSPVVTITSPLQDQPLVLAETGAIIEYLTERWGPQLIPKRASIESPGESNLRNRYFMHYVEGSLMSLLTVAAVMQNIKNAPVPFFIKPITKAITGKIGESYLEPNFKSHFEFLEQQLKSAPGGGGYLCGNTMVESDIMLVFPLQAAQAWAGLSKARYPVLMAYLERMVEREAYKQAERRVVEVEGSFKPVF
ncbi:bifunctional glutathione transferase/peroxidase [Cladophialophora chaetospira]|uniref:glutathione transferase n=1 Tax=Cladophialophora chaetospira TaxID=386627 RepID=A0AA38XDH4_9EURO|nr:bifunctional glutathione transferase/peroxidase [Cladophialophora chaetospira]